MSAGQVTMTSREIADLVEKRHDNVARTIETLAERGVIALPQFEEVSNPGPGPSAIRQFRVGKRDSYIIVAQLSPEFTARLVDRWQELENQSSTPTLPTYPSALRQLADEVERGERQRQALALAAPKVEFVDRYATSAGDKGIRETAKLLGANERHFIAWLEREDGGCLYRLAGQLMPRAPHMNAGRFVVKTGIADHSEFGHAFNQVKFTPKGVTWIAGEWAKHQLNHREAV